ncbi:MAG: CHAT domain-containing protein [Pyrinomonadaceae bacterium]|nr:CHAT domain-containing protein [Pyrinomonadaceae bacterium]
MKKILRFSVYSFFIILFVSFRISAQTHNPTASAQNSEIPLLVSGQTFEKEISNGEKHLYKLSLKQNQFVKIEVLQTGCDVMLSLQSPEKINVFEFKNENEPNGAEFQTAAVETAGDYELRVINFDESGKKGKYALRIAETREATEKELSQTSAFKIVNGLAKNVKSGTATAEQILKVIGDFETALEKFRFAGNQKYEAMTLSSMGSFYTRIGNWNKAVELQKRSIEINRKIGAEDNISLLLTNLGTSYLRRNEPQKALEVFHESIKISEKREDIFNEIRTLNMLGNTYEELGDTVRAHEYQTRALEKAETEKEDSFSTQIFGDLGRLNANLGENRKAVEYFQKAIEAAQKSNNKRLEASAVGNLGVTFFGLGEKVKAFELLNRSLEINRSLTDKFGEAAALKKIGNLYLKLGENDKAIENIDKSLEIYRSLEDTQNLAETLLLSAKTESQNLEAAQSKSEEAISLIEKIRLRVNVAELRDSFSANLQDFYSFYIETLMKRHRAEPNKNFAALALQASERARARGLLNLLAESNTDIRQGIDEKLIGKEQETQNFLTARLENLTKVLNGKAKSEEIENLKQEITKIRADYEQIQLQIRTASPHYSSLTQPKTLDLTEIQTQVLDENTVLLEYVLGERQSYLWIVGKSDFRAIELPAKFEIEQPAREFYEALTARNKQIKFETDEEREIRIAQKDADLRNTSDELSAKILAPAMPFLNGKSLLIVADGALQYVPFAALRSKKDSFLVETNEIVNLPSASVLVLLRQEFGKRAPAPKTLAVLADPIFDKTDERFQAIAGNRSMKEVKPELIAVSGKRTRDGGNFDRRDGFELQRLPFTRFEAEKIGTFVPENQREKLLDFAASRRSAMSPELANYRFVHFATHGILSNENPELSGIAFSMIDEKGREQDGFLRVGDIYNLKFPAEMVVLSGCKTGLGREIKGEGLVGLTRGFMYAGAKRVTVSLWDVNDEATSELMAGLYKEMLGANKLTPAVALRRAQISMLKDKRWQNPYFWSTFILQGEPK